MNDLNRAANNASVLTDDITKIRKGFWMLIIHRDLFIALLINLLVKKMMKMTGI